MQYDQTLLAQRMLHSRRCTLQVDANIHVQVATQENKTSEI